MYKTFLTKVKLILQHVYIYSFLEYQNLRGGREAPKRVCPQAYFSVPLSPLPQDCGSILGFYSEKV